MSGVIGMMNKNKLTETLVEIAFKEVKESIENIKEKDKAQDGRIDDLGKLVVLMDKKIDKVMAILNGADEETDGYDEYKNGKNNN